MFNEYIPEEFAPFDYEEGDNAPPLESEWQRAGEAVEKQPFSLKGILSGGGKEQIDGLLKSLNLGKLDSGDILLILLILFLLIEGDDHWELVITLGLLLLLGLADKDKEEED